MVIGTLDLYFFIKLVIVTLFNLSICSSVSDSDSEEDDEEDEYTERVDCGTDEKSGVLLCGCDIRALILQKRRNCGIFLVLIMT